MNEVELKERADRFYKRACDAEAALCDISNLVDGLEIVSWQLCQWGNIFKDTSAGQEIESLRNAVIGLSRAMYEKLEQHTDGLNADCEGKTS